MACAGTKTSSSSVLSTIKKPNQSGWRLIIPVTTCGLNDSPLRAPGLNRDPGAFDLWSEFDPPPDLFLELDRCASLLSLD